MSVYHNLREMAERDRKYGTANQELNRQVSMYSRILVAREATAAPDESVRDRVAVSLYIARIFLLVGTVTIAGMKYMTAGVRLSWQSESRTGSKGQM